MKKKNKNCLWCLLFGLLIFFIGSSLQEEQYQAANIYTNAKEFYYAVGNEDDKHIDVVGGTIYFGTRAKLAHTYALGHKYYVTLGYDVTLSAGGKSITFSVKRDGSLAEVSGSAQIDDAGYQYLLYSIPTKTIINLAKLADSVNAETILSSPEIKVRMDAIITVRQNMVQGSIEEDGKGGVIENETYGEIYHLKNETDLTTVKHIFGGHSFSSYTNIVDYLYNYQLTVLYNVGPAIVGNTNYGKGAYSGTSNMLFQNGSLYNKEKYKIMQEFKLLDPGKNGLNLNYTGYHLDSGSEWKKGDGTALSINKNYISKDIEPSVMDGDKTLVVYANWKANTYQVIYNAKGGSGTIAPSSMIYDETGTLRSNTFQKTGYYLSAGEEWMDENGKTYANGEEIKNLTSEQDGKVVLYANWKPCVYSITTDLQNGTGGTEYFYEVFEHGFFSDEMITDEINQILLPSRVGYNFLGYYNWMNGGVPLIVESDGRIKVESDFFTQDSTIYANWEAKNYMVTFDKQGGEYGSDTAIATYDKLFPIADAPVKTGYSFRGYYTEKDGKGICIYNEFMSTDVIFQFENNMTVYAYWVDDNVPKVSLNVNIGDWTNQKVTLTANAWDLGSGLKSLIVYRIGTDGELKEVASNLDLNGVKTETLSFQNKTEGIVRYKAVAEDMKGNIAESYNVVSYDITAPIANHVEVNIEGTTFYFEIDITDINTGD